MALAFKELRIHRYPNILLLHLNRFKTVNEKKVKNNDPVAYREVEEFGGHEYRLLGVVIHEGGLEAGHYWSVVRRGNGYMTCNDNKITATNSAQHKNAYMLLYTRP